MSNQSEDDLNYLRWLIGLCVMHYSLRGDDIELWQEPWRAWIGDNIVEPLDEEGMPLEVWDDWRDIPRHLYLKTVTHLLDEIEKLYGPLGREFAQELITYR